MAIAAALLLTVSTVYMFQARQRLEVEVRQSAQNLSQERERSSSLNQQLKTTRELAQPATVMLSLVQTGIPRGESIVPELMIGSGTRKIHVEIALPLARGGEYSDQLETSGKVAWHLDRIQALFSPDGALLMFAVPALFLTQGQSKFVVSQKSGAEITYPFAISKE